MFPIAVKVQVGLFKPSSKMLKISSYHSYLYTWHLFFRCKGIFCHKNRRNHLQSSINTCRKRLGVIKFILYWPDSTTPKLSTFKIKKTKSMQFNGYSKIYFYYTVQIEQKISDIALNKHLWQTMIIQTFDYPFLIEIIRKHD